MGAMILPAPRSVPKDELPNAWLKPLELIDVVPEVVPGYPDRILLKNEKAASGKSAC
jgi:hypothetical protein